MRPFKSTYARTPSLLPRMRDYDPQIWFPWNEGWDDILTFEAISGRYLTPNGNAPYIVKNGRWEKITGSMGIGLGRNGFGSAAGTWPFNRGYTLLVTGFQITPSSGVPTFYFGKDTGSNRHYYRSYIADVPEMQVYDGAWNDIVWTGGATAFDSQDQVNLCLVYSGTVTRELRGYLMKPQAFRGAGDFVPGVVYESLTDVSGAADVSADFAWSSRTEGSSSAGLNEATELMVLGRQFTPMEARTWVQDPRRFWRPARKYFGIPAGGPPPGDDVLVDVPEAYVDVRGYNPGVEILVPADNNVLVDVPSAPIQVSGIAPTVGVANDVFVELPKAAINIQGGAPTVNIGDDVLISLPAAQLQVQAYGPSVLVETEVLVNLPAAQIEVEAFGPDVLVEENVYSDVPAAQINVEGAAPMTVLVGDVLVNLPAAEIRVVATGPRVVVGEPDDAPGDAGIVHGPTSEVVVEPTNKVIT